MELEKENNIEIKNNIKNEQDQKSFLETTLGKTINAAIDIGIRALLPDFIDEQVINIKDNLLEYGLKDGIKETIDDAIDLGKSAIGIVTGNFENMNQIQNAIDTEINAILLKHILNYANNPKITVNKIQTIVSSPRKIYTQGSAIETLDYVPEKVNGFFYDQNVVGYSTLSFANNDRLISFIKIDNLENKSKTEMKNLTQFEFE